MTDQSIEGTTHGISGNIKKGIGNLTDDPKLQIEGKFEELKGKALDAYGRVIDKLETLSERTPADLREPVRTSLNFARRRPLLTTGIIVGMAIMLFGSGRRRG